MKPNDPKRFAQELQGDFSEVDAYIRGRRIDMLCIIGGILVWTLVLWLR